MTDIIYTPSETNVLIQTEDDSTAQVILTDDPSIISIEHEKSPDVLIETVQELSVLETEEAPTVVESIEVGPQGPPGTISNEVLIRAAIPIGGHRVVVPNMDGKAIYADNTIIEHANRVLGVTINAADVDGQLRVVVFGEIEEPSWDWEMYVPIWLHQNGLMFQYPPTSGFSMIVGFPRTNRRMFVILREPIVLI